MQSIFLIHTWIHLYSAQLVKNAYQKNIFLILKLKRMLWVLERTFQMRWFFFKHSKHMINWWVRKIYNFTLNIFWSKCDKCPAVFNSKINLREHQRRHNKDYSHYCDVCAKGFYTITNLEMHRRIHTGEKPYSCLLCDYTCNAKPNLDKHIKIHGKPSSKVNKN